MYSALRADVTNGRRAAPSSPAPTVRTVGMLLWLCACAPTNITLCEPTGRFVLPEPDYVVLDGDGRLSVTVEGECLGDDALVVRAARVDEDAAGLELACDGGDPLTCTAAVATAQLAFCSGEPAWSTLRLYATTPDGEPVELDAVGVPLALVP